MTLEPTCNELNRRQSYYEQIQILGRVIGVHNHREFQDIIGSSIKHGVIDITGWTISAVDALLRVCSHKQLNLTLKRDTRYFMLSSNPKAASIPIVARAIYEGNL